MSRRTHTRLARPLSLQPLEPRTVPTTFEILSLGATGSATVHHDAVTGGDYGGIAASSSQLFVTGQSATGRFNLSDLSGGTSVGAQYQGIVGDLHTQKVFVLGNGQAPLTVSQPFPPFGVFFSQLLEVNPATGALTGNVVNLSQPVPVSNDTGIFAGYDRVLIHPHSPFGPNPVYQIDTSTGTVTPLQNGSDVPVPALHHMSTFGWAYYGTAEHFGGNDYLDYVQDTSIIARELVSSAGSVSAIGTPGITNLADMASFTVSPTTGRWYFHYTGSSQFAPTAPPGAQIAGYATASFQVGDFVVTNTNDTGTGSLRQVIADANATGGPQVIGFQAGLTGTINLSTPINVTEPADIEGPGSALITVSGASNLFNPSAGIGLTVHGLTLTGTAAAGLTVGYPLTASGDVTVSGANVSVTAPLTTSGSVALNAGSGNVTFTNTLAVQPGTLTLTDGNGVDLGPDTTVDGTLAAASGFDLAAGNLLDGTGAVSGNVADAGTLGGTLTVFGNVTVKNGGTVSPGPFVATLTVNGNLTFRPGGTFTADIDGNGFADQVAVNGLVDLGTANMLNPVFGFPPSPGDANVLIANDGTDALSGLLNGVRNRSGEKLGSTFFQVRYDGGDGNDLELVANNSPVLDMSVPVKLDPLTENVPPGSNPGTTVDALVAANGLYSDAQGPFRSGLAFTGLDNANGSWQYSRDGGTTWTNFGTLSNSSATLLEADGAGKNRVRFLPGLYFFGTATITFKAWDTTDGRLDGTTGADTGTGGGNSPYSSGSVSATVQVLAVNQPPVAIPDAANLVEDGVAQPIDVLANDTDPDAGDTLTVIAVSRGLHGTVAIGPNGSDVLYTPDPEYYGPDQFLYTITDSHGATSSSFVTVNVASNLDDRLEVDTTPGLTTFTEKVPPPSTPVTIDPGIQIGPGLEGVITGATVRITAGAVAKKDQLVFPFPRGFAAPSGAVIKGSYSASTFALTLTGTGTQADYQAALGQVQYLNPSPAPVDGIRQIAFQLKDAAGAGPVGYKSVQVIGVNTSPVLKYPANLAPVKFKLGKAAVAVAGPLSITDLDNTHLQGATVTISGGLQAQDALTAVTTNTGITATYDPATGKLTLTGNATIATYLKVLKSVKFSTTAAGSGSRTLSFQVTDGEPSNPLSNIVTRTVTVG